MVEPHKVAVAAVHFKDGSDFVVLSFVCPRSDALDVLRQLEVAATYHDAGIDEATFTHRMEQLQAARLAIGHPASYDPNFTPEK